MATATNLADDRMKAAVAVQMADETIPCTCGAEKEWNQAPPLNRGCPASLHNDACPANRRVWLGQVIYSLVSTAVVVERVLACTCGLQEHVETCPARYRAAAVDQVRQAAMTCVADGSHKERLQGALAAVRAAKHGEFVRRRDGSLDGIERELVRLFRLVDDGRDG